MLNCDIPEVFAVKPGEQVSLTLDNTDEMIHNLVLVKGDAQKMSQLAELALKLGEKGMEMGFIPPDPSIIAWNWFGSTWTKKIG